MPAFTFSELSVERYLVRAREARETLSVDAHRPRYHFCAPANWLNDPNGLIQWRGVYHLFYQHIPDDPAAGAKWWGHAASTDLVHWEDRPLALAPTQASPDRDGIWSGCCLAHAGRVYALYTGFGLVKRNRMTDSDQRPCLAWATDDSLNTWVKYQGNPLFEPPDDVRSADFRDHTAWQEDGWWYQVVGSSIDRQRGAAQLYRSHDLKHWEYRGRLAEGAPETSGWMWECPSFFPLEDKHVLITSPIPFGRAVYMTGRYAAERFTADAMGELDTGGCFYAPQTFPADDGRRLMFGWLWENLPASYAREAGWAGAMSLPRVLTFDHAGALCQQPAAEVDLIRGDRWLGEPRTLNPGQAYPLAPQGMQLELDLTLLPASASRVYAAVRRAPDGSEYTLVGFDAARQELFIDRSRASLNPDAASDIRTAALRLRPGEPLKLRIYLDGSVIEVFANGRLALASRIYPQNNASVGLSVSAEGGQAELLEVSVWQMGLAF